jgi:FtsP/CotA-like multicopper oxidase with cupredoxin domain
MKDIKRRDFLKYAGGTVGALVIGNGLPWIFKDEAYAAVRVQSLSFEITDAQKEMVTFNTGNPGNLPALCYFWIFKEATLPADCPGPNIFCTEGDLIKVTLTNKLDEDHNFFIRGVVDSGPIAPGATKTIRFKAPRGGTYLYHDSLNEPVNRVMGLHGAFVSMPRAARPGHKFTPYSRPTANVQKMYDDFGGSTHYPGLAWEQGDPATGTPPFRQYLWLVHDASPKLFADVGNAPAGVNFDSADFVTKFTQDPFTPFAENSFRPQYFTMQGQSGHFSHNHPFICPNNRVGEPVLIRCLHAGLQVHSMHIHANHVWVTSINGVVSRNPLWVDTMTLHPLDTWEYTVPYMRPPDIPNVAGIGPMRVNIPGLGFADTPRTCLANPAIPGSTPHPVWPPNEELNFFLPAIGAAAGVTPISVQLSPMCYPMHDHSEPTQTAQGGNYNMGLISGLNFTGDRNALGTVGAGGPVTFPNNPTLHGPSDTGTPAGPQE